ncbi:activator of basal transcription 1-like [Microplitis mediator]|uniref:activator of basal transcription 1-like n=1 Tax=Microplitis mediator TaxID=375433 RepID=UPI0025576467|nr:activator of basal transcription 1-like [Microplitis mediator]
MENENSEDEKSVDFSVSDELNEEEKKNDDKRKKKYKRGIIYISQIPKYMNCAILREMLSVYGKIDRVYLQLANSEKPTKSKVIEIKQTKKNKNKRAPRMFSEGWVEFESKKIAKFVAEKLNKQPIATRKGSRFYDILWNIKYLSRFKWIHLSERLAYEKAVHKQRLRTEISQAKRESTFFAYNLDRSKKLKLKEQKGETTEFIIPEIKQRETDMEIRQKKNKLKSSADENESRKEFLQSIF